MVLSVSCVRVCGRFAVPRLRGSCDHTARQWAKVEKRRLVMLCSRLIVLKGRERSPHSPLKPMLRRLEVLDEPRNRNRSPPAPVATDPDGVLLWG